MRNRRERTLKELYDVSEKLSEPKISPVLIGEHRMQGPVDEYVSTESITSLDFPVNTRCSSLDENPRRTAEPGTCNACSAPCVSCLHLIKTSPLMQPEYDCSSSLKTSGRKEDDSSLFIDVSGPIFKIRTLSEHKHACREGINLMTSSPSCNSLSANAESRVIAKASVFCDTSENVEVTQKALADGVEGGIHFTEETSFTSASPSPLFSSKPFDTHHIETSEKEKHELECLNHSVSCTPGLEEPKVASHACHMVGKSPSLEGLLYPVEEKTVQDEIQGISDNNVRQAEPCRVELQRKISTAPSTSLVTDKLADDFEDDLDPITRSRSLKAQSPCSVSENAFSSRHSYDSRNVDGVKEIQSSIKTAACTVDGKNVAPSPNAKSSNDNQTLVSKEENDAGLGNVLNNNDKFVSFGIIRPTDLSLQPIMSSSMIHTSNAEVSEVNKVANSESEDSDEIEYDVKVCDICGDAGQEDFLAICSRCDDGAEHTYCMRTKLREVPEGDWLCEECQMKEDAKNRTSGKFATESQMTENSLNVTSQKLGRKPESKCQPSTETKAMETYVRRSIKQSSSTGVLTKQNLKNPGTTLPSSRNKTEVLDASPRTNFLSKATSLSRESSFSKPNFEKLKISLDSNPPKMQSRTELMKGPALLKSLSFNSPKVAKVKQLTDAVTQKRKACGESSYPTRDEGPPRKITKSVSFKNASSGFCNIKSKADFPGLPQSCDFSGAKVVKERSTLDKKISSLSDHPAVPPPVSASTISHAKLDKKAEQYDQKLKKTPEWANTYVRKRLNDGKSSGSIGKKHVPQSRSSSTQLLLKYEDQKHNLLSPKAADARDSKSKEFASVSSPRAAVSGGCRISRCQRCNEPGHSTQTCPVDRLRVSTAKPSFERISKDQGNRGNRCKDSVEVAIPKLGTKGKEQYREIPSGTYLKYDMTSKDIPLPLISAKTFPSCPSSEGPFDAQKMLNKSTVDSKLSTVLHANRKSAWQNKYQNIPKKKDVNDARITTNISRKNVDMHDLSNQSPILAHSISSLVIPHPEHIWQGAFEVLRSGNAPVIYDGFQAYVPIHFSPKAVEVAANFPCRIKLEEVPRKSSWSMQFLESGPNGDNITLYFFAKDSESHEKYYLNQLDHMIKNDLALRGSFDTVELLIFPSSLLSEDFQRWNNFFFLWGVFKGNKKIFSKELPVCEQKLPMANFRNKPIAQDLFQAPSTGLSFHHVLNINSEKDISTGEISVAKRINFATKMELQDVSGTETKIYKTRESFFQKNDHKELAKKNLGPSSTSGLPSRVVQLQGPLTIPERKIHIDVEQLPPDEDSDAACLNDLANDSHSRGHAGILHDDCFHSKTSFTDPVDYFSGYASKPNGKDMPWEDTRSVDVNDKVEREKMKLDDGGHAPNDLVERTSACKSSSKIHPLTCDFMDNKFENEISKSAEKCLFALDGFSGTRAKSEDHVQTFCSDDKQPSDPDGVDLELALGDKKNVSRREVLPLFSPKVSQKSKSKLPITSDVGAEEPAMLTLSLAFPASQKAWETKTISEPDQLLPGKPCINASLNLFKKFYDITDKDRWHETDR